MTVLTDRVASRAAPRPVPITLRWRTPMSVTVGPNLLAARSHAAVTRPVASVILPAYNEEGGVAAVLDQLRPVLDRSYELIVVDDGSTDRTALVAELRGARVIRHQVNQGKGAALRTGFAAASADRIITLDADGTYPVSAIPAILTLLHEGHGLVIGARQAGAGSMSPVNRIGNQLFRLAISITAGRRVRDPLSGMYGLRRDVLERLSLESDGFGIETEIVIRSARAGASIAEVPISYQARIGESKLHPWRDGMVISRTILRMIVGPLRMTAARLSGATHRG